MSVLKIENMTDTDWEDANKVGENLRNYLFVNDNHRKWFSEDPNYKQLGCYETFEIRKDAKLLPKWLSNNIFSQYSYDVPSPGTINGKKYTDGRNSIGYEFLVNTKDGKILVSAVWHWRLNGTLIFQGPDFTVLNDNCERRIGWTYMPTEQTS